LNKKAKTIQIFDELVKDQKKGKEISKEYFKRTLSKVRELSREFKDVDINDQNDSGYDKNSFCTIKIEDVQAVEPRFKDEIRLLLEGGEEVLLKVKEEDTEEGRDEWITEIQSSRDQKVAIYSPEIENYKTTVFLRFVSLSLF